MRARLSENLAVAQAYDLIFRVQILRRLQTPPPPALPVICMSEVTSPRPINLVCISRRL